MSHCQSQETQCACLCHTGMLKHALTSMPSKPCCDCLPLPEINELPPYGQYYSKPEMQLKEEETITIKKSLWDEMMEYKNKLDNLEKWQRGIEVLIGDLQCRIKELERFQDITHKQHENVIRKKQPHKCPVCDGRGGYYINGVMDEECRACEGNGIVWG